MNLFNTKKDTEMKLMGVHIPKEDANRISLYSLLEKTTRSEILKTMINEFLNTLPSMKKLIELVIKELKKDFKNTVKYKKILIQNLSKKKIPKNIINQIIQDLENK